MRGYQTPPGDQGQIVEVSYLCAGPHQMLRRVHDRSDGTTRYYVAQLRRRDGDWYETYEAANGAPPIPASRWRLITADEAQRLEAEVH